MEWVEVTGTTIEDAKESALRQLGVEADDAEILIVSEPTKGLFGRMRGEARVKARVRPAGPRPKRNRSRQASVAENREFSNQRRRRLRLLNPGARSNRSRMDRRMGVTSKLVSVDPSKRSEKWQTV